MRRAFLTGVLFFLLAAAASAAASVSSPARNIVPGVPPRAASVVIAVPAKPPATAPADYGRVKETISDLIKSEMRKNDIVGLSIALVDDQRIAWSQGFGYADEEKGIAAAPENKLEPSGWKLSEKPNCFRMRGRSCRLPL